VSESNPKVLVVIPAGGSGTRFGGERKQFKELGSDPVVVHTIRKFELHPDIDSIIVATPSDEIEKWMSSVQNYRLSKVRRVVSGGDTRQASVYNALSALQADKDDIVLIHDAVRPFVSEELISNVVDAAIEYGAAAPVLESVDTLRMKDENFLGETLDRSNILRMQTPQAFKYGLIMEAHEKHQEGQASDDVTLAQAAGQKVKWVVGEAQNLKITKPEDWKTAVHLIENN